MRGRRLRAAAAHSLLQLLLLCAVPCLAADGDPCFGGPTNPAAHVDYTECDAAVSGDVCNPTCADGYTVVDGAAFTLNCSAITAEYDDDSGAECERACANMTAAGSLGVEYDTSQCEAVPVGSRCSVTCHAGFSGAAVPYVCGTGGAAVVLEDPMVFPMCFPGRCAKGATNAKPGVDYSACKLAFSGGLCTLRCAAGYRPVAADTNPDATLPPSSFPLLCDDATGFEDPTSFACEANACSNGVAVPPGVAVPTRVDYAPCTYLRTGEICTPACPDGRPTIANAYSFPLVCEGGGSFDDPTLTSTNPPPPIECGDLVCGGTVCGPTASRDCAVATCRFDTCTVVSHPAGTPCALAPGGAAEGECLSGVCVTTDACRDVECTPADQCHGVGTCDDATGDCAYPTLSDGTPCDDGNIFTHRDACRSGVCVGEARCDGVDCTARLPCQQDGVCDRRTGLCDYPPLPEFTQCAVDGIPGRTGACRGGSCILQLPCGRDVCDHVRDPCVQPVCRQSDKTCLPGVHFPDGIRCDDGDPATHDDACVRGACVGKNLCDGVTCPRLSQCHEPGVCDPATGLCANAVRDDNAVCNDGDPATEGDRCVRGRCLGRSLCFGVACAPSDGCHMQGVCNPVTGACSDPPAPDGTSCNDGDPLTDSDVCTAGVCRGERACGAQVCKVSTSAASQGSDLDPQCAVPTCISGVFCTVEPALDGTPCNDFDATTHGDSCRGGRCAGVDPCAGVVCSSAASGGCIVTECRDGRCATRSLAAAGTPCDDGDVITARDACNEVGECVGVFLCADVTCRDGPPCNAVRCNPATGACTAAPLSPGTPCDDTLADTTADTCEALPATPSAVSEVACIGRPRTPATVLVQFALDASAPGMNVVALTYRERNVLAQRITAVLLNVLILDSAAALLSVSVGDDGVVAALAETARFHRDVVADVLKRFIVADLSRGSADGGSFAAAGVAADPQSPTVSPLDIFDECTVGGTAACSAAGQLCIDPLPYSRFTFDWVCRCQPYAPAVADGAMGPAECPTPQPPPRPPVDVEEGAAAAEGDGLSTTAIMAIGIGGAAACAMVCAALLWWWCWRREQRLAAEAEGESVEEEDENALAVRGRGSSVGSTGIRVRGCVSPSNSARSGAPLIGELCPKTPREGDNSQTLINGNDDSATPAASTDGRGLISSRHAAGMERKGSGQRVSVAVPTGEEKSSSGQREAAAQQQPAVLQCSDGTFVLPPPPPPGEAATTTSGGSVSRPPQRGRAHSGTYPALPALKSVASMSRGANGHGATAAAAANVSPPRRPLSAVPNAPPLQRVFSTATAGTSRSGSPSSDGFGASSSALTEGGVGTRIAVGAHPPSHPLRRTGVPPHLQHLYDLDARERWTADGLARMPSLAGGDLAPLPHDAPRVHPGHVRVGSPVPAAEDTALKQQQLQQQRRSLEDHIANTLGRDLVEALQNTDADELKRISRELDECEAAVAAATAAAAPASHARTRSHRGRARIQSPTPTGAPMVPPAPHTHGRQPQQGRSSMAPGMGSGARLRRDLLPSGGGSGRSAARSISPPFREPDPLPSFATYTTHGVPVHTGGAGAGLGARVVSPSLASVVITPTHAPSQVGVPHAAGHLYDGGYESYEDPSHALRGSAVVHDHRGH